mgnify:FL=1
MDNLLFGLGVTAVGMLVVFFGLIVLIGLIKIMTMLSQSKKPKEKEAVAPAPVAAPAPVEAEAAAPTQDDVLIAVISAAVAATMGEETGFVVRRVRRISNAPAWQRAGRDEQVYSRF